MSESNTGVENAPVRPRTFWAGLIAITALGLLVRVLQVQHHLTENHAFRQTQTALVAKEYLSRGIDLTHTWLPVFGPNSQVPMEFPIFQGLVALIAKIVPNLDLVGQSLALMFFAGSGVLLTILLRRWVGAIPALFAAGLFQFLPFGIYWGSAFLIEFVAVFFSLLFVFFGDLWFAKRNWVWLVAGSIASVLAFLIKSTTAPVYLPLLLIPFVFVLKTDGWVSAIRKGWIYLSVVPALGLVAAVLWTRSADAIKSTSPITKFITSQALADWNFGSLAQRKDPAIYLPVVQRMSEQVAGPFLLFLALAVLGAVLTGSFKQRVTLAFLGISALAGPLIFLNLYYQHEYYISAIYAPVVGILASGLYLLATSLGQGRSKAVSVMAVLVMFLGFTVYSTFPGGEALKSLRSVSFDGNGVQQRVIPDISLKLKSSTPTGANVILAECTQWDPEFLYYANRRGLMISAPEVNEAFPEIKRIWSTLPISDYSYLATCSSDAKFDPAKYLPSGVVATKVGPQVYELALAN
jgi:hypothetical protein